MWWLLWAGQGVLFLDFKHSLIFVLARNSSVPLTHISKHSVSRCGWLPHIFTALDCGWVSTPDAGRPELQGICCKATKPVSRNKHLSCANWSVKCTNCWGEDDVSAGEIAPVVGSVSGPTISWSVHWHTHTHTYHPHRYTPGYSSCRQPQWQLLFTGCLPHLLLFILAGYPRLKGVCGPLSLMSLLRGSSGKIISDKHLDHLFTTPNSPQLYCGPGPFRCKWWGCQMVSLRRNTNATRSALCELCESVKCWINWVCQGDYDCCWSWAFWPRWVRSIADKVSLAAICALLSSSPTVKKRIKT